MKKVYVVTILVLISIVLCGYTPAKPTVYLTIHYNGQRIVISDNILQPKWFNAESHTDFTKGKKIHQRAADANNLEKDFPEIYQTLKKIKLEIERKPFDGNVNFDPTHEQKFWITGAQHGVAMDIAKASEEILAALKNQVYADIIIKTKEVPHASEKAVLSKIGLRASYSTRFDAGNQNRSANIRRSAACFNGLHLLPGETLSFNKTVGPRTAERGYEEAKIIIDGEFVPGVGGGVCQTSTTLFNAALMSGLTVKKSQNHSLPISYVPLGRDAMVSSAADLVLENNTEGTVYIESGIQNGTRVFVKVYGSKLGSTSYKPTTEVTEAAQETEVVGSVPTDTATFRKIVLEEGYPARSVRTYLETYSGGRQTGKKLIRKSSYKGKKQIIKYEQLPPTNDLTTEASIDILGQ